MSATNKDTVTSQDPGNDMAPPAGTVTGKSDFYQRRKLLKVSAVTVPAIMTLRSGAAAAMASVYQCLNHPGADTTDIDPVLGDDPLDPPHDEWVRIAAKPGKMLTYVTGSKMVTYYCIRKNAALYTWDDVLGWDCYDDSGKLKDGAGLADNDKFMAAWPTATVFYCLPDDPTGWVCIDETGTTIVPTIPGEAISLSDTQVYLLAYYDQETGLLTYYPMEQGAAVPITGSCLCSIDPTYQL